jgi:hypothetical protein
MTHFDAEEAKSHGADLDNPAMAHRIVEDISDGIRAYGKEAVTRVHFFPAGMLAYPIVLGAMLGNWCPVVVYHRTGDSYVPLYEMNKDWIQKGKHDFPQLKEWEVLSVPAMSKTLAATHTPKEIGGG